MFNEFSGKSTFLNEKSSRLHTALQLHRSARLLLKALCYDEKNDF